MIVLTFKDLLKNIVKVQKNKTTYLINRLQNKRFAQNAGQDIVIFFAKYSYTKKNGNKSLLYKDLFSIQDREYSKTRLDLLYYCKQILVVIFANICRLLRIVNSACTTVYSIVIHLNGIHSISNF